MNGWLDGWITNLSLKKKQKNKKTKKQKNMHACMHIRMIMNREKEEK